MSRTAIADAPVPEAPARGRGTSRPRWQIVVGVIALAATAPILLVVGNLLTPSAETWQFLVDTGLGAMIWNTLALTTVVVTGSLVLGGGLAWLVGLHTFPGRRLFSWLLVLPLAFPTYVLGFIYIGMLSHPGPVQSSLRAVFGADVWFPEVRSFWFGAFVLTLAFYPYPYLLVRSALADQSATTYEAARTLGASPLVAARRVLIPLARPSLAAGGMVVAMETLTDFVTAKYFGITTVSVGIEQVWVGMYDRAAASELAGVVMLFALGVIAAERLARGGARFHQHGSGKPIAPESLSGRRARIATLTCAAVLAVAFVIPLVQLLVWSRPSATSVGVNARFFHYVANTAVIAAAVAVLCVAVGALLASASRLGGGRITGWLARAASVGYAVPGPVVAIGVLILLSGVDAAFDQIGISLGATLVTGTVAGLLYAYVVRFLALAWGSIDAGLEKVPPSLTLAGLSLGARPARVMRRVHVPLLRTGLGVALVLVAVDTLKELPIMLLLRPFGFETLAVWVNQLATESRWESAGVPALTIVVIAVIPIVMMFRRTLSDGNLSDDGARTVSATEESNA